MFKFRRFSDLFVLLLGLLGVVVCAAAIVLVWFTGSRLSQTNENAFDKIDTSLAAVRDRILSAQKRVQESKLTTEDIGQSVKEWTRKEASDRLASRLEVEKKAERLALGLRQADLWLEMSGASIQGIQQTLEIASSLGAPVDATLVDPLLDRLGTLQSQLNQSTEKIDEVRGHLANTAEGETLEGRINRVAQLALRVVATLGAIDSRLGQFADRLADTQASGQLLNRRIRFYIATAQICAALLIAWMAAGQVSLCRDGWRNLLQRRSAR